MIGGKPAPWFTPVEPVDALCDEYFVEHHLQQLDCVIEKAEGHVILLCGSDGLWQQVVAFARALNQDVVQGTDVVVLCPQVPTQDLQMSINWKQVIPSSCRQPQ